MLNFHYSTEQKYFIARSVDGKFLIDNNWADEGGNFELGFDGEKFEDWTIYKENEVEILKASIRDAYEFRGAPPAYEIFAVIEQTSYDGENVG